MLRGAGVIISTKSGKKRKTLFLGDALIGKPPGAVTLFPEEKYDDIQRAKAEIRF